MQNMNRCIVLGAGKARVGEAKTTDFADVQQAFVELAERGVEVYPKAVQVMSQQAAHQGADAHANVPSRRLIIMVLFTLRSLETLEDKVRGLLRAQRIIKRRSRMLPTKGSPHFQTAHAQNLQLRSLKPGATTS